MEVWIENEAGIRQGAGPITTATGWTQTPRLNAAGEFSFTMPALDPRAAYVRTHRWARAWHFEEPGGWRAAGRAAPSDGPWLQGDMLWNSDPDSGDPIGWVCTEAGSPGTWKAFGTIA